VTPWIGLAFGLVVIAGSLASVVATLIVPRGTNSRLARVIAAAIDLGYARLAARITSFEARDRALGLVAPLYLLGQLITWMALLLAGWALVFWPVVGGLGAGLRLSGSSMFTLGFASSAADGGGLVAITLCCAATGVAVVALQISYLPTLYGAFNRRETLVTMLESRGGEPVWGPEILSRHILVDILDNIPTLYAEWERWAADVAESHVNYPVLMFLRSPNPKRSWILGLLAILDAAALQNSLSPLTAPSECRLVLRMGFTALRDLAGVLRLPFDPDPNPEDPIALTEEEFRQAVRHMEEAGWHMERSTEEAWANFRGWRVNYESTAYAIADRIDAPRALWAGPRRRRQAPATAPNRPTDRRPAERSHLLRTASKRRAMRTMSAGRTLPPALRQAWVRRMEADAAASADGAAPAPPSAATAADREAAAVMRDEEVG
jgi:hypothetical protein